MSFDIDEAVDIYNWEKSQRISLRIATESDLEEILPSFRRSVKKWSVKITNFLHIAKCRYIFTDAKNRHLCRSCQR